MNHHQKAGNVTGHRFSTFRLTRDQALASLINPRFQAKSPDDREHAARTAGTILVAITMIALYWSTVVLFMPHSPNLSPYSNTTFCASLLCACVLYLLARTAYFKAAGVGVVVAAVAMIFLCFALDPRPITAEIALRFLVVPTALACIMLSIRATLVTIAAGVLGLVLVSMFHVVNLDVLLAIGAFVLFGGMLILSSAVLAERRQSMKLATAKAVYQRDQHYLGVQAANDAKTRFLAYMSHELRTPLTSIVGFTALALDECPSVGNLADYLLKIHKNSTYLVELVESVLDLSQIEAGQFESEAKTCSPVAEVQKMIALHRDFAEKKGLSIDLTSSLPALLSLDVRRLRQIVGNLLHNALKFTSVGGVRISLTFVQRAASGEGQLMIVTSDSGQGFTAAQRQHLFKPQVKDIFTPAYSERSGPNGAGLGLALSHDIAVSLGGSLHLEASAPGQGSEFILTLPASVAVQLSTLSQQAKERPQLPSLVGIKLLVVDDNDDIRLFLATMLSALGGCVVAVSNGQEAVEEAAAQAFDIILMDLQMPGMDGLAATRELRSLGISTPIIALTGHALFEFQQSSLQAGCNDYLTKPVARDTLLAHIMHQLPRP